MSLEKQLSDTEARMAEIVDELEAIGAQAEAEGRDLNEADQELIAANNVEYKAKEKSAETLRQALATKEMLHAKRAVPKLLQEQDALASPQTPYTGLTVPAAVRNRKSKVYENTFDCYAVGQWIMGILGNEHSKRWAMDHGFKYRGAMEGGTDTLGGFAVPDPMAATIIRLVEEHGVFRQYSRNAPMTSDNLLVPKYDAGLTVYYPAEGAAITASDITFGQVNLVATKYAALAIMSTELNEDAVISMTDLITTDIAYKFAQAEDANSFLGDGSAPFGGITGISGALQAGSIVNVAGGAISGVTLGDLEEMLARCPQYQGLNPRWYMHSYTYHSVVVPALVALGGTDMRQTEAGGDMMLYGYPVTFTQVLPGQAATVDDLAIVFGDLSLGSYLGTRRNVTIRVLNELYAANDQIGVVGTLRSATNIYDVGDATTAGCIIGLKIAI